eukprot:768601-Hanusia_phi.AAC.1
MPSDRSRSSPSCHGSGRVPVWTTRQGGPTAGASEIMQVRRATSNRLVSRARNPGNNSHHGLDLETH